MIVRYITIGALHVIYVIGVGANMLTTHDKERSLFIFIHFKNSSEGNVWFFMNKKKKNI